MKFNFLSMMLLCFFISNAQDPILLKDIYPGSSNSVESWGTNSIQVDDNIYFIAKSSPNVSSLYLLKNDEVTHLKECDSDSPLILYKNQVLFAIKGGSIWAASDNNVSEMFNIGLAYVDGFIVGGDDKLYITSQNKMYVVDGTSNIITHNFYDVAIPNKYHDASIIIPTENGIAFSQITNMNSALIIQVSGNDVDTLGSIDGLPDYTKHFGIKEMKDGYVFAMANTSTSSVNGIYILKNGDNSIVKLANNTGGNVGKIANFLPHTPLVFIIGKGYFTLSGSPLTLTKISGRWDYLISDADLVAAANDVKGVFYAGDYNSSKDFIILTDGSTNGSKEIEIEDPYPSNFYQHNDKVFFAEGTSNGYKPVLQYVDLLDDNLYIIKKFDESASSSDAFMIIGNVGSKLYYFCNLDQTYGREIYSIETGIRTETIEPSFDRFKFKWSNGFYMVSDSLNDGRSIHVEIFDIMGRKINDTRTTVNFNQFIDTNEQVLIFKITDISLNYSTTFKVLNIH